MTPVEGSFHALKALCPKVENHCPSPSQGWVPWFLYAGVIGGSPPELIQVCLLLWLGQCVPSRLFFILPGCLPGSPVEAKFPGGCLEVTAPQDSNDEHLSSHSEDVVGELKIVRPENRPAVVCNGKQITMWLVLPLALRHGL